MKRRESNRSGGGYLRGRAASLELLIDPEQDKSADNRTDPARALSSFVPPDCLTGVSRGERSGNAEQRSHYKTHVFFTRHDQLRNHADNKTDDNRQEKAKH